MEIIVRENYPFNTVDIYVVDNINGKRYIAKPMVFEFEELKEGLEATASFSIDRGVAKQFLQGLATALNQAGYRDNTTESFKSELTAVKYHLEDMRKLSFKESKQ